MFDSQTARYGDVRRDAVLPCKQNLRVQLPTSPQMPLFYGRPRPWYGCGAGSTPAGGSTRVTSWRGAGLPSRAERVRASLPALTQAKPQGAATRCQRVPGEFDSHCLLNMARSTGCSTGCKLVTGRIVTDARLRSPSCSASSARTPRRIPPTDLSSPRASSRANSARVLSGNGSAVTCDRGADLAARTSTQRLRDSLSPRTAQGLLNPWRQDRYLPRALTSRSTSGSGRLILNQQTRVQIPHETPRLFRWIRYFGYEPRKECSIHSGGTALVAGCSSSAPNRRYVVRVDARALRPGETVPRRFHTPKTPRFNSTGPQR